MLADLLHRIRRGIWRVIAGPSSTRSVSAARCMDCGKRLTADEREYYEVNCERCEGIEFRRLADLEREHFGDPDKETGIYAPSVPGTFNDQPELPR